jgi:ketosteroid isomerase-like protein
MNDLDPTITEHFAAIDRSDAPGILATFADDALLVSGRAEFWGKDAIAKWIKKELIDDKVTVEILEVIHHHGDTIVRGRYDGIFDRTNLPAEVVLTNYFRVRDGKISELFLILKQPAAD